MPLFVKYDPSFSKSVLQPHEPVQSIQGDSGLWLHLQMTVSMMRSDSAGLSQRKGKPNRPCFQRPSDPCAMCAPLCSVYNEEMMIKCF